jgi:hypothetical protein
MENVKFQFIIIFLLLILINPIYAQETKNPSIILHTEKIPFSEFNKISRNSQPVIFEKIHAINWQVTIENDLLYANPNGNAVLRLYDVNIQDKFIEVGMGSPPNNKFWVAAQLPETGYVVIHNMLERGWSPSARVTVSYTDTTGLTVNNGVRIVVSNIDVGIFAIGAYSVYGMESSSDPPAINSGILNVEFLSGDPAQNVFHFFPFYVTAAIGVIVGILYLTKKRS